MPRLKRFLNWFNEQSKTKQSVIVLLICFSAAVIAGILFWVFDVFIRFFVTLVSTSELNLGGGLHLHHGLIGLTIVTLSLFAVWWFRANKLYVGVFIVACFIGLMLMLHDQFTFGDSVLSWLTFS
jgi:hypothetical protein